MTLDDFVSLLDAETVFNLVRLDGYVFGKMERKNYDKFIQHYDYLRQRVVGYLGFADEEDVDLDIYVDVWGEYGTI